MKYCFESCYEEGDQLEESVFKAVKLMEEAAEKEATRVNLFYWQCNIILNRITSELFDNFL